MFGIIYGIFSLGCNLISGIKNAIDYEDSKRRTYDHEHDLYITNRGVIIDAKTNKSMSMGRTENGDRIYTNVLTGYTRNIDQEDREKEYNKLKYENNKDITVALFSTEYARREGRKANRKGMAGGYWYKDLNNGKLYVKRRFMMYPNGKVEGKGKPIGLINFYMDKDSGKIVRTADKELEKQKNKYIYDKMRGIIKNNKEPDEYINDLKIEIVKWIKDFNINQNKTLKDFNIKKAYIELSDWDKEFFYHMYFYDKQEGVKS